jgi:hypothetical protein
VDAERKNAVDAMFKLVLQATAAALTTGIVAALVLAKLLSRGGAGIAGEAKPTLILYPVFVMFFLVAAVLTRMGWLRIGGVLRGTVDVEFYRTFDRGEEPEAFRVVTRHFINLFEMPVLFYVGAIFAVLTHQVTYWLVGLAWAYAGLRLLHSYVHLTSNDVPKRLSAYVSSGLVLLVFWISLFTQILRAA